MADADKTIGGSPWDEPLPEEKKTTKLAPTVVGDLDVVKKQQGASVPAAQQKPVELKVPTDTDEKVGAKLDPAKVTPATTAPAAGAIAPAAEASKVKQNIQPAVKPPTDSNFWQTVYGQSGNPDGSFPAKSSAPSVPPAQPITPNVKPIPAAPIPNTSQPSAQGPNHLSQPAPPTSAPRPQMPIAAPNPQVQPVAQQPMVAAPVVASKPVNRMVTYAIAGVLGVIILFAGGVFLTEKGLISIGLEKVYGAIRLEALWGGLPANAENAFAISAVKMKSEKSFKVSGNATVTVNKGVKSDFISPIVSAAAFPVISFKDEELGPKVKAVLAAVSDKVAANSSTDLFQTDSSTNSGQSSTSTQPSSDSSTSVSDITTVEELTTDINAQITDSVSGAKIGIKSSKSANSDIQLVYSKNKMYLKTSTDIIYDSQSKGGWTSFDLSKFGSDNPGQTFWSGNFSGSSFSIVGSRGKSEIVNGVRCFHYTGRATIGDALSSFDLTNGSVSSLDLDYWLGANDHLIHKLTMKIIPGSQSAISRIDITLDFSDFGSDSTDFIVPATSSPYSGSTITTKVNTANLPPEKARDAQRKADLANIAKALESYHASSGKYPQVQGTEKISASSGILYTALVPTYLTVMPIDPRDPTDYYGYESNGTTYKLSSVLEDKTDTSGKAVGSVYLYFLSSL